MRVGTTGVSVLTIHNIGDGNTSGRGAASNLNGSFQSAAGTFSAGTSAFSLADASSMSNQYVFAPSARGQQTQSVDMVLDNGSSDGTNRAHALAAELVGTGVGPSFTASLDPATGLAFGSVSGVSARAFSITNASLDPDLGALTALTLVSYEITGPDAARFSLSDFAAGQVLGNGQRADLGVRVTAGGAQGELSAVLTFHTDQQAAFGGDGSQFSYSLFATAVPEPQSGDLMAAGLSCLGLWTLRRSRVSGRVRSRTRWSLRRVHPR
ncbi:MAG: hypothetical protein U1F52_14640 [Burkholderiales bacterium]